MNTNLYINQSGVLYRFDPRAKLLMLVVLSIVLFLPLSLHVLWLCVVISMLTALVVGRFRSSLRPLKTILLLLILMVIFAPLSERGGTIAFVIYRNIYVTNEALEALSRLASRLITITYLFTIVMWTTTISEMNLAFQWYGLSYKGSLIMSLAFRFVPSIADSFTTIQQAFELREEGPEKRKKRMRDVLPTVIAALVVAIKSIPYVAMNLEHRGLGRDQKRSRYKELETKRSLVVHLVIALIIPACIAFVGICW
ncbi:MAG: energy-coupling factor transporter transmembrane component T family protein [Sphaerochaetaceae bacterium]|jgi:energy-coupling factor transport system permease protein